MRPTGAMQHSNRLVKALVLGSVALALTRGAGAQESEATAEIEVLKKGQEEIRRELQEIKRILQGMQRPAAAPSGPVVKGMVFGLGDNPVQGASTAKLTLVEFTDYQ